MLCCCRSRAGYARAGDEDGTLFVELPATDDYEVQSRVIVDVQDRICFEGELNKRGHGLMTTVKMRYFQIQGSIVTFH